VLVVLLLERMWALRLMQTPRHGRIWMSGRWSFLVRRVMSGQRWSLRLIGRMCVLMAGASADVGRLWLGLPLLLPLPMGAVGVVHGVYFGGRWRNC
jgi:hypothetical protein